MFSSRSITCLSAFKIVSRSEKHIIRNESVSKKPILYGDEASPPVRFAMITVSLLNIDLEFRSIDLFNMENRTEFYKEINPLQKVPALSVNGDMICDSHAISLYFCRSSNNQELYPEDPILQAKIDELLYFNSGILFPIDSALFCDFFAGKWPAAETKVENWHTSLDHLEMKLNKQKWLTGDKMRLCDICCGTTVSSMEILLPVLDRHEHVKKWLKNLKSLPCFEINARGLKRLQSFVRVIQQ